jgi:hypothetical protein
LLCGGEVLVLGDLGGLVYAAGIIYAADGLKIYNAEET